MAAVDFARLSLVILLYFITVLTLSFGSAAQPDVTPSASSFLNQDHSSRPSLPLPTMKHSLNDSVNDEKIPKNITSTLVMVEGGPISLSTTIQHADIETVTGKTRENMPKERNAIPSVVARKGVEEKKVKPRKGVNQTNLDPEQATISFQTTPENVKPVVENVSTMEITRANNQSETSNINTPRLNATNPLPNDNLGHDTNSSLSSSPMNITVSRTGTINNATMSKPSSQKHIPKPKPTVTTIGKAEIDESRLSLRNKSSLLGMPRKVDYIVPVIITIIVLPLLGGAIFIIYRRGRDCWDKRHYRRMDFLIDGMYND